MRMLVRQNKYYNNLTNINNIGDEENNVIEDNDYGHFCELDIEDPNQKNITNYNKYYVYNYNYSDQKKDDDIDELKELKELKEIKEKYNDIYFIIHLAGITATGIILLYFTLQ